MSVFPIPYYIKYNTYIFKIFYKYLFVYIHQLEVAV